MATKTRRLARVGAVIAIAAAAGQFVQADRDAAPPLVAARATVPPAPAAEPAPLRVADAAVPPAAQPEPPAAQPEPPAAQPQPPVRVDVARASALDLTGSAAPAAPAQPLFAPAAPLPAPILPPAPAAAPPVAAPAVEAPCVAALDAVAMPGALLTLVLTAPCRPEARVVLRHAGLAVSAQTSAAGTLTATLPAFDPAGAVVAQFDDGLRIDAAAPVADLGGLTRFAVQWVGADAFQLHAFRGDAVHGGDGHVHAGAPGARSGSAGHLMALGTGTDDRALRAEVYTFPGDAAAVRLDLEAAVTDGTCGREILGETLQWSAGTLARRELTLPMPPCGEGAGYLVLQNPMDDLTLAAR